MLAASSAGYARMHSFHAGHTPLAEGTEWLACCTNHGQDSRGQFTVQAACSRFPLARARLAWRTSQPHHGGSWPLAPS